jgi:NAD(P)-dependent dehydrogenase (short-subunit alcohol dehydrogenase family)
MPHLTALIVGGTSGVGLATARQLQAGGNTVHIAGRGQERLDDVRVSDPELLGHRLDANDASAVGALGEAIAPIDCLILTLSGSEGPGPIADLDLTMLRRAFDAKFWGHLTAIQALLPHMAPTGSITLLGAITARAGMPGTAGIAAINGAVEALVKPLATELAPIRVNGISPGFIDTPWWDDMPEEARRDYFARAAGDLPTGRIATAEDVAEVVVLAATNANTTGTIIETDGGARLVSIG